jgi:hypothetical protein
MRGRLAKLVVVLAGIVLGQAILYGPSLAGRKILLPLDILARPNYYLPSTPELSTREPHNRQLEDLVLYAEPNRRFLGAELRSGRFPLWNPYQFAGVPDTSPKFSPFTLLSAAVVSPRVIPWIEFLKAIVSGLGFYFFCRRVLQVAFWPAAIAGWCYPLTGFFVLWQGFGPTAGVLWLPWLLLAVAQTVRQTGPMAPFWLTVVTGLVLTSGQLDVAGQVLLASGLYALWCWWDTYRQNWLTRQARNAALSLAVGWGFGFLLAAPYLLPVLEYTQTGTRMARRFAGAEERPPVGLAALPQVVLPKLYGSPERGSVTDFPPGQRNLAESSAATYTGLLATLFVAPLAWCSRRHRSINLFWSLLGLLALSWCLNVPVLVKLLRLPGLNMMSHNRFVFAASFAILALTAVGLNVLWEGYASWRWWFWLPAALCAGLCVWCITRALAPPDAIEIQLPARVIQGDTVGWIHDLEGVREGQAWFARTSANEALLCGLGLAAWLCLWARRKWSLGLFFLLGLLLAADLIWFGLGRAAQCDPTMYYPRVPVLDEVARSDPGRIIGYNCLPANLASMCGLRDIRGYDGIDPAHLIDVIRSGADPQSVVFAYARAQWLTPHTMLSPSGDLQLPPVFDMLGVRYVICRGAPLPTTRSAFQGNDYWVMVNSNALARVFIPRRVETVTGGDAQLQRLGSLEFDPREVAYVESAVGLPGSCRGSAEVVGENPTCVRVSLRMETPGLVVLADLWDKGWKAYLNGKGVAILRTNYAIRGVVVPAGPGTLEFRYRPASFIWGLRLAGFASVTLLAWLGRIAWSRRLAGG